MMLFLTAFLLLPAVASGRFVAGGINNTVVSPTHEAVVFAVQAINEQFASNNGGSSSSPGLDLVKILQARTQVVSGQLLYLRLQLTGDYVCDVTVWYRIWLQDSRRLQISSGPSCTRKPGNGNGNSGGASGVGRGQEEDGSLLGGISELQPLPQPGANGYDDVWQALEFAACAANDRNNQQFAVTLAHTFGVNFSQQVTAGLTYRFKNVPLVSTHCENQGCGNLDLARCPANTQSQITKCNMQVQFQAWMSPQYQLTDLECWPDCPPL